MNLRFTGATLAAMLVLLAVAGSASGALIGIYRNAMETEAQRGDRGGQGRPCESQSHRVNPKHRIGQKMLL